jgi:tetratricopeptide (TPR) repeat protein
MWGFIAFGLLILFGVLGYEAALKYRSVNVAPTTIDTRSQQVEAPGKLSDQNSPLPRPSITSTASTPQSRLSSAFSQHRYREAIGAGRELYDTGNAAPEDLSVVSLSYFASDDCPNSLIWANRARDETAQLGKDADPRLDPIRSRCEAHAHHLRIRPDHVERAIRLFDAFGARAEVERQNLPQLEANAQQSRAGELDIKLGELYFGFGDYAQAVVAIQRGLAKGQINRLDEAYVYLGRSEVAQGNIAEARNAFAKLKTVPNVSPRVLGLWELYAETLE